MPMLKAFDAELDQNPPTEFFARAAFPKWSPPPDPDFVPIAEAIEMPEAAMLPEIEE